jgi:hypothetical protein
MENDFGRELGTRAHAFVFFSALHSPHVVLNVLKENSESNESCLNPFKLLVYWGRAACASVVERPAMAAQVATPGLCAGGRADTAVR